jgi:hypothetical protein
VLGLDIHIDTPTEILHTILLGLVKYLWAELVLVLDKGKSFETFATLLRSIHVDGLNFDGPVPSYITTNQGSLNGKHFKIISQVAPFCLHGLIPDNFMDAWYLIARLAWLAWQPSIKDLDVYTVSIQSQLRYKSVNFAL